MATQHISSEETEIVSVFQSALSIPDKLERARTELLDLSARNRLLNIPQSAKAARSLEIIDEHSGEVFRLIVREARTFTFLPGKPDKVAGGDAVDVDEIAELAQPEDESVDERGILNRRSDTKLQTRMTPAGLQKRLLDLHVDAKTLEEEQGVNILYLALGTLKWIDPANAANIRYAPLILIPVSLERGNAAEKFKLRWRQEEPAANLSLEAFLEKVHGIKLPPFDTSEDFDPIAYIAAVAEAVSSKQGWSVQTDHIVLGFFSFAKFLMYRDLDASIWPKTGNIAEQPLIRSLLADGFEASEELVPDDVAIDPYIAPGDMLHIVDSDSSQTLAVHEVRRGRNLVIQGPPGTGKSQTIANIIASAIADGKTVLFLAEKMAALEVVKRRLDATGVGDACLELHSNKANKRALLVELRRTWHLGSPKSQSPHTLNDRLVEARDRLNAHATRLHTQSGAAGLTPYAVIGQLTRLKLDGHLPNDIRLTQPESWSADDLSIRQEALLELAERVQDIGPPTSHAWCGIGLRVVLPTDVDRYGQRIEALIAQLNAIVDVYRSLAVTLALPESTHLEDLGAIQALAARVATAPLAAEALGAEVWGPQASNIAALLDRGATYASLAEKLAPHLKSGAWEVDVAPAHAALDQLPEAFPVGGFSRVGRLRALLPDLLESGGRLSRAMEHAEAVTLADLDRLVEIGERVAVAPDASPQAFLANQWDGGVERAGDIAEAVAVLETTRDRVGAHLSDAAWSADLAEARSMLAAHGTGILRWFSGEWRRANRLVRSFLASPTAPLGEILSLLDALGRGQDAQRTIRAEQDFGQAVFDLDWRGEKSTARPLQALVAWMRSLRGLGPEPRLIVSKQPDRAEIGNLARRTRHALEEARTLFHGLHADLGDRSEILFDHDASAERATLATTAERSSSLDDAWRSADAVLLDIPAHLPETLDRLAELIEGRSATRAIAEGDALGNAAFGPQWRGAVSEWTSLKAASAWIAANSDIRLLASGIANRAEPAARAAAVNTDRARFFEGMTALLADLSADPEVVFGRHSLEGVPIADLAARLRGWGAHAEGLSKWVTYRGRAEQANALGLEAVVDRLHQGRLEPVDAIGMFEMSYYEAVFAEQAKHTLELAWFDGDLHSRRVREFGDLDRQRIAASSYEVVREHHRRIPPTSGGAAGPLGILRSEMERKRGHMPIRQLVHKAAPAIQALKPVFMMSPLSVAQFLPPGDLTFDLLVMDEASQIQPVDALGAIARCRQVVVVGDPKQLPPTAFFSKVTGNASDEDDAGDGAGVADIESILGLFTARGLPTRMLRWHYRSRHQSLIAVSNKQFYENKLYIIPSPHTAEAGMGLRFHHVSNGIFETGTTRTNPIEAKIVAQAIVAHAREHPELSLGVAAFSSAQRRAILDQVELLRRTLAPEEEAFFQSHPSEPFFIKNLENVQGDERDVIFISVGYGPSAPGRPPTMRFGPLGSDGGERRLNVLISRAKRRCEVFSSITDEQIDPDFASSRKGVFAFKLFLHFARTGRLSMSESTGRDHDSVFEEQVACALHDRGFQVKRQVGIAGFFIDLAIADPAYPDRYILGIECDGAAYHESRSARDRDRLRQTILEDHGWMMHRIWSTDWFQRPGEQLDRVVAAIEAAKAELGSRDEKVRLRAVPVEIVAIEREDVTEIGLIEIESTKASGGAYVEASLIKPRHLDCDLHAAPRGVLSDIAQQVVVVEGPIHIDEVVNRIRESWGLKRAGGRIQDAVEAAIAVSVRMGQLDQRGDFLAIPGAPVSVRDRSNVRSASLRQPHMLPPTEIHLAMLDVVRNNFGATQDQVLTLVSRALGFKSTKGLLRSVILPVVRQALKDKELIDQHGVLMVGPAAQIQSPPKPNGGELEALIAQGEHERLEFKQTLRWDIALDAINKKLEDVAIKTVAAFANGGGGVLVIGVGDDGRVTGLDSDLQCLGGNCDKMELHLTNLFNKHFGQAFRASRIQVSFPTVQALQICKVDVKPASGAIFVSLADQRGTIAERFFVRSGNSSQELSPSETQRFVKERFR